LPLAQLVNAQYPTVYYDDPLGAPMRLCHALSKLLRNRLRVALTPGAVAAFAFALWLGSVAAASAADLTVFAAASLKESLDEQAKRFAARTGNKVVVAYGASNALAKQIESAAPADIFIAADVDWMDYVAARGLIFPNSRVDLLRNALVLIAPRGSPASLTIGGSFALAAALGTQKLAMGNPDSVPAGKYGKAALERLGVWSSVEKSVARTENVRAALALVSRGEAPFGIVYATDAKADKGVRIVDAFPANSHPPIVYPAAILASAKSLAAQPFLDYLRGAAARPVWENYGFTMAQ
jgi:molybdate transport system substrate-binding protein